MPLQNSTLPNSIILTGNLIADVGAGITAEWSGPVSGSSDLHNWSAGKLILSNASNPHTGNLAARRQPLLPPGRGPDQRADRPAKSQSDSAPRAAAQRALKTCWRTATPSPIRRAPSTCLWSSAYVSATENACYIEELPYYIFGQVRTT